MFYQYYVYGGLQLGGGRGGRGWPREWEEPGKGRTWRGDPGEGARQKGDTRAGGPRLGGGGMKN